jgi:hypothetical protein
LGDEVEKQEVAFERLHALVRKGYRPEIGSDGAGGTIALRHLARAPDLLLHADGRVEGLPGRVPHYKRKVDAPSIPALRDADQIEFLKFLDNVPRPRLRDRTRRWRTRWVYLPASLMAMWGVSIALTALIVDGM